jgi:putative FmdB family regulatory protein
VIYVMECESCKYTFEIPQSIHDDPVKICPECGESTLSRVIQPSIIICKGAPTTLGHHAHRKTETMGTYEYQDKLHDYYERHPSKAPKELPWWAKDSKKIDTSLANLTPQQQKTYIETGIKP